MDPGPPESPPGVLEQVVRVLVQIDRVFPGLRQRVGALLRLLGIRILAGNGRAEAPAPRMKDATPAGPAADAQEEEAPQPALAKGDERAAAFEPPTNALPVALFALMARDFRLRTSRKAHTERTGSEA